MTTFPKFAERAAFSLSVMEEPGKNKLMQLDKKICFSIFMQV